MHYSPASRTKGSVASARRSRCTVERSCWAHRALVAPRHAPRARNTPLHSNQNRCPCGATSTSRTVSGCPCMPPDSLQRNQTSRPALADVPNCSYRTPLHRTCWLCSETRCHSLALVQRAEVPVRVARSWLRSARRGSCSQPVRTSAERRCTTRTAQLASSSRGLDGLQTGRSAHTSRTKC